MNNSIIWKTFMLKFKVVVIPSVEEIKKER